MCCANELSASALRRGIPSRSRRGLRDGPVGLTFFNSSTVTRRIPNPVPLRSFPLLHSLAQSKAEQPGANATFPFFPFGFEVAPSPPLDPAVLVSPPFWIPKSGFLVVEGGGAISPIGTVPSVTAILRSEAGSSSSVFRGGDGGARLKDGVGAGLVAFDGPGAADR